MRHRAPAILVIALSAVVAGCNGSPDASHVTPLPSSDAPASTPTPSPSPTLTWDPDQLKAIAAAGARYIAAVNAGDRVLSRPTDSNNRATLEKAGAGGPYLMSVILDSHKLRDLKWYRSGLTKNLSAKASTVNLSLEQPEVHLDVCNFTGSLVLHHQGTGKPVIVGAGAPTRLRFAAKLVLAPSIHTGTKMWFLMEQKAAGTC